MSDAIALDRPDGTPVLIDTTGSYHPPQSTLLGFWLYLMSDCFIFGSLFAVYGVLGRNYAAGPSGAELFELPMVALNTALLLTSSITYGMAMVSMQADNKRGLLTWLAITGLLGACFLGLEIREFSHLIAEGAGPQRSAFLTSFFALVGTHGLHVFFGVIWLVVLMIQLSRYGLIEANRRRVFCLPRMAGHPCLRIASEFIAASAC